MAKEKEVLNKDKETVEELQYWQWIKGENSGNVVTIKNTDDRWINFHQGGRLAIDLKDEFIQLLDGDLANEFIKTEKPKVFPNTNIQKITGDIAIPTTESNPIRILLDKQKRNNKVKLLLEFPVNIPSKDIYELMKDSFGNNEVKKELESFVLDQLSEKEISDCLHNSVQSLIESKYKGE